MNLPDDLDAALAEFREGLLDTDDAQIQQPALAPQSPQRDIDEEIKVTKKRKTIPKLDDERLLSQPGIPTLRRRAKKLKFRGKGFEYQDMGLLLGLYQGWLDDLYPRAKFRDGAAIIEKLGHSKRMNVMRKAWIQETRPVQVTHIDDEQDQQDAADVVLDDRTGIFDSPPADVQAHASEEQDDTPGDDELDMLLAEEQDLPVPRPPDNVPAEDDLDALLAEEEITPEQSKEREKSIRDEELANEDEEQWLRELED